MEESTPAGAADKPKFADICDELFAPASELTRPTRAGTRSAGFDPAEYAQANLLEVHFADGSVYYTDPQEFLAGQQTAAARSGQADMPVQLPFALRTAEGAGLTRGGSGELPVDRYRIARLTPPTSLDRIWHWGAGVAKMLDRLFGAEKPPLVEMAGAALCHAYESSQLDPAVGEGDGALLAWQHDRWAPAAPEHVPPDLMEVVLLLHGTASSTEGSFRGLWQMPAGAGIPADWQRLVTRRGTLTLAYEHRSLTASPIGNVLGLVNALKGLGLRPGTTIHLLSHSRGGLVGELLTLALGTPAELRARATRLAPLFADLYGEEHADEPQVAAWLALLGSHDFAPDWRAGTFVRVACPARGTLLADRRTDFFLSLLLRSVGLAFGGNGNPWYERLQGLVRGLVASRTDAGHLPGLEAMIPGAPLSLVLNDTAASVQLVLPGRLRVIAGDSAGSGTLGLATLLGDLFYGLHDHDFVVHTHAMFGGFARSAPMSRRVSDRSVTHFGYFLPGSLTRSPVIAALLGDDTGFVPLADDEARTRGLLQALRPELSRRSREAWLELLRAADAPHKPILVVLPGIMGSELAVADRSDDPVWLSPKAMFTGDLALVNLHGTPALEASGLMAIAYERLLKQALPRFHVVTFAFDWRRPIPESAAALVELLKQLLQEAQRLDVPVHLLAHSMGGLVARLALWCDEFGLARQRGELTKQLEARGLRLLQCGTPNLGSYAPLQLLMQQHPLTRGIARIARKVTPRDLASFGARFPGLMAMMPAAKDPAFGDLFLSANWAKIVEKDAANAGTDAAITPPDPAVLNEAAKVRDWLAASFDALKADPRVFYLAGKDLTPLHLKVIGGSPGRPGLLRLGVTMQGDGTVPWASTLAPERTFYIDCGHGALLDHAESFSGMFDLLLNGRTQQLPSRPPALRGDDNALADAVFELTALPSLPADPAAHVLGLDRRAAAPGRLPPVRLRIVHGSLDYARYPLLVGHCSDDGVHGAVKRVDTKLEGQLGQAVDFGLFNGALGTSLYLRDAPADGRAPAYPGAIVVGLGALGTLTPAGLADTLARGVLDHAFARLHQEAWSRGSGPLVLNLSAVLVGSNTHSLSVRDSVAGILQGVWRAAQALAAERKARRVVQIGELEIVELHETVALDAAYAVSRLLERPDWQQRAHWPEGVLEAREGGVRGYRANNDAAQWQRLMVRCDDFGAMKFELIADRARVETTRNRADISGLEDFIAQACDAGAVRLSTLAEQDEFGRGLFNQLLPQALRSRLANFQQTVVLVDDRSARLPWELLAPPRLLTMGEEAAQPLAIQAGLLRQRSVEDYRLEERTPLRRPGRGRRVLVIGDPDTDGWTSAGGAPVRFARLPGAVAEAVAVGKLLDRQGWEVQTLVRGAERPGGAKAAEVRWQLMRPEPWRVLHIAGHGMVDLWMSTVETAGLAQPVHGTGMVLSAQRMLTADMVELMDPPPEFVFLNCCYSGKDGASPSPGGLQGRPTIAASLALAFMRMGSKAVVAAGWQVDDTDGQEFAETLYRGLLRGDTFGAAVLSARQAIWRDGRPRSNTWGAYQCYGSPEWRLIGADTTDADPLSGAEASKSPQELADRILNVLHQAGDGRTSSFRDSLHALTRRLREDTVRLDWLKDSQVLAALAMAWRELGETTEALEAAFAAIGRPESQFTLGQAEKAANLLSKVKRVSGTAWTPGAAMEASWRALEGLDKVSATLRWPPGTGGAASADAAAAERDCLRGSALARLAEQEAAAQDQGTAKVQAKAEEGRRWLRLRAASWYAQAFQTRVHLSESAGARAYALSNAVILASIVAVQSEALRPWMTSGKWWQKPLPTALPRRAPSPGAHANFLPGLRQDIETTLSELHRDDTIDFWGYAGMLDLRMARLLLLLLDEALDTPAAHTDLRALPDSLEQALLRWPSPGQLDSLSKRPREVLTALQQGRGDNAEPPAGLSDFIDAVQRLLERLGEVRADLAG